MKQSYDFWYSKKQAARLRQRLYLSDSNGRETRFHLTEFLVDGEWHEYTEMRTSGEKPISQYDDLQKLGTGTTSDTKIDGVRQGQGAK